MASAKAMMKTTTRKSAMGSMMVPGGLNRI